MSILPNLSAVEAASGITPVGPAVADRLRQARVGDARIPDGRPFTPSRFITTAPSLPAQQLPTTALPPSARPYAQRPIQRQSGLRLLRLDSFVWGGAHQHRPTPRTRADQVLLWTMEGSLRVDLPRSHGMMHAGEVRFLPAGTAFATNPLSGVQGMALLLAPDMTRDCDPSLPDRMVAGEIGANAAGLSSVLTQLAREFAGDDRQSRSAIACQLSLLSITLQRLEPVTTRPAPAADARTDLTLVQSFTALADAELGQGRTVADLAEDLGTTSAALDRACIAARGRRAIQLIHDLRHEHAVRALRRSTRPLDLIARDLGYTSLAHFNRAFVDQTGRLPAQFRSDDPSDEVAASLF